MWDIWANKNVATSFEWLPKLQKIAQSGHTDYDQQEDLPFCRPPVLAPHPKEISNMFGSLK